MEARLDPLRTAADERLGDALRAVAVGDPDDRAYEVGYIRPDVAERYSPDKRAEVFQKIVLETMARARQTDLFPLLGEQRATVRVFERGTVVVYWGDDLVAFVAVDDGTDRVAAAIDACEEAFG